MAGKQASKVMKIKNGEIHPLEVDGLTSPCLIFKGDEPPVGANVEFALKNGVTYVGKVCATTKADGEVLVEFERGIQPK